MLQKGYEYKSSLSDLRVLIDFLRTGDAVVEKDTVSLRKLRLSPLYRDVVSRFPVLLPEYFSRPSMDITNLIPFGSDGRRPSSGVKPGVLLLSQ